MKATKSGFFSGMTSGMIFAALGTLVLCIFITIKLEVSRELPSDYERLDQTIAESQTMISELVMAPVLPPLAESWKEVNAHFKLAGLDLVPDSDGTASGSVTDYSGPLKHWTGYVLGGPKEVMALVRDIQQSEPVYLLNYQMLDGEMRLYLAVVGISE